MQFQVPQFIETEDKVIGPLTLKQFGFIAAASLIVGLLFLVLKFYLWIIIAGIFGAIAAALSFGKVNGRPLIDYLAAFWANLWRPRVYVFKPTIPQERSAEDLKVAVEPKVKLTPQETPLENKQTTKKNVPLFGGVKGLRSWIATSKSAVPRREKPLPRNFSTSQKELDDKYEVVKHITGEREVAKRIDYR